MRKRDVRLTDASAIKQISTALTSVTAVIVETFVRTAASPNDDLDEDEDVAYESDDSGG